MAIPRQKLCDSDVSDMWELWNIKMRARKILTDMSNKENINVRETMLHNNSAIKYIEKELGI